MKLSIIIPAYRVEATLDRCIESVLAQNIDDFEVILVDDGSPDNCPQMCDEWAQRDRRIRVIHKPNGGLGDARNAGVSVAQGEYVTFADSDDYLHPDTYPPLMQLLEDHPDYDFVEYPVAVHYGSTRQSMLTFTDEFYDDINSYWTTQHTHRHCYVWNKIFKRHLFEGVLFPIGHFFDDANTFPRVLKKCHKVATSRQGLYYYCDNSKGLSGNADYRQLELLLTSQLNSGMPIDDYCYMDLVNIQMDILEFGGESVILPRRRVRLASLKGKQKLKGFLLNILGIKRLCKLNKSIHSLKKSR
jgi:glycosyltransferase involved in cell wall biosynthesis